MRSDGFAAARWIALLLPLALILGALGSQYVGHLIPCEMCHWQRWPHYAAIVLAALAFVVPGTSNRRMLVVLAAIAILASGVIGGYQAGTEYHWWQGETSCTATVTHAANSADLLKQLMAAPLIRCDQAQWTLFGISLAGYNAIISILGALVILTLLIRSKRFR